MDIDSFEERVSISGIDSEDITLDSYYWSPQRISIRADLEPSTEYTVRIAEGARDRGGRPLPAYEFSFTTQPRSPSLSLAAPASFSTLSAEGEQVLYYHAARLDERALPPLRAVRRRSGDPPAPGLDRQLPESVLARERAAARLDRAYRRGAAECLAPLLPHAERGRAAGQRPLPSRRGVRGHLSPLEGRAERRRHGDRDQANVRRTARLGPGLRHRRTPRRRPRARRPGRGSAAQPLPDGRHRRGRSGPVRRHLQPGRLLESVRQLPRADRRRRTRRRLRDLVGLRRLAVGSGGLLVRVLPRLEGPSLHRPAHLPGPARPSTTRASCGTRTTPRTPSRERKRPSQ